jgi:hypothetical protein
VAGLTGGSGGPGGDRGQAFTLEGLLGAFVVLTAVLFAVQAVVGTSTVGGQIDDNTRTNLRVQANDVLSTTADAGLSDLSYAVRYWSSPQQRFYGADSRTVGYGEDGPPTVLFGDALDDTFVSQGRSYNVVVRYRGDPTDPEVGPGTERMLWRGSPRSDSVVASHTATLYDNMTLTAPDASSRELWEYDANASDGDGGFYPIPDADPDGPLYNVVEVRVIVW